MIASKAPKSIALDGEKLIACVEKCQTAGVGYGLGSKAPSLSSEPGKDFKRIDCSGFVRWAVYQASPASARCVMPDGSSVQADWADAQGFKVSTVDACLLHDGRVRLARWNNKVGVGHIVLVMNGRTIESHGGKGPDRRVWSLDVGWMAACRVWVLDMAKDDVDV